METFKANFFFPFSFSFCSKYCFVNSIFNCWIRHFSWRQKGGTIKEKGGGLNGSCQKAKTIYRNSRGTMMCIYNILQGFRSLHFKATSTRRSMRELYTLHKLDFVFHWGCNRYYKHIGLYLRACIYDWLLFHYLHGLAIDRRLVGIRQGIAEKSGNKTKKRKMF